MSQKTYLPSLMPPDKLREEKGFKGEYELFRAAQAAHSMKHPNIDPNCKLCEVIYRNLMKLQVEAEELVQSV